MSEYDDEMAFAQQFPFRPDHPDFERLTEIVAIVEKLKHNKVDAQKTYEQFMDVYSVAYLAANRAGMNLPDTAMKDLTRRELHVLMTDTWVEGLFFGVYFQILGGTRKEQESSTE